ncbi:thiol-disulfide oxidoreductase [Paenibacillaceae bacterium]|nr:thiol-disulfide oxidoreductase [Paenibacillaceae bacterium]
MGARRKTIQIAILLGVLLIGGYAIGKTLFANDSSVPKPGEQPPAFTLGDLNGNTHKLEDYVGRPLVINFWGTFCKPCVTEMPTFQKQYDSWKEKGLDIELLAINLSEPTLPIVNFVRKLELTYPIVRDVGRKTERAFGIRSYPTTIFVKPDGKIMEIFIGPMSEEQIEQRVEQLLQA